MDAGTFLDTATKTLRDAGVETARLDCLVMLEDVLGVDRASLLAHPEIVLTHTQLGLLNNFITQRCTHVPVAYIRGEAAFFGRNFIVNKNVLVPRPETETMIEMLLHTPPHHAPRIADIGTGSGCIGITIALELPAGDVWLYDIDEKALRVAEANAASLGAEVHTKKSNLLKNTIGPFDVIVTNLPYVPQKYLINKAATHEPSLALFSGNDGLDLYRRFWDQVAALHHKPSHIFTEALPQQHEQLGVLAANAGYAAVETRDFIQHFTPIKLG